jgi:hypothetical protein
MFVDEMKKAAANFAPTTPQASSWRAVSLVKITKRTLDFLHIQMFYGLCKKGGNHGNEFST